jgi:4,5-dihydroxyphthalate decarboxylase
MADADVAISVMGSVLTAPLTTGEVVAEGVRLEITPPKSIDDLTRRMLTLDFDIGEMAISTFIKARDDGAPIVALPLFTSGRRFLHAGFHFAAQSALDDLSEIKGRRIAVPQYWMSSSVWQRGMLLHDYGVAPSDVSWVSYQPERIAVDLPAGVALRLDDSGRGVAELLAVGEADVSMSTGGGPAANLGSAARPVFPDREAAQQAYFQRTGIFPILHTTVMKEALATREPWIVASICTAYQRAKELAQAREMPHDSDSPGSGETTNQMRALMGDDAWPFGIEANRKALESLVAMTYEQGMNKRRLAVEELFAPGLLAEYQ